MRAFHFYVDDWLSSKHVRRMDAHEERGYLRLLLHAATEIDCGLPTEADELADISLLGAQWGRPTLAEDKRFGHQTSGEKLRACFFVIKDGQSVNALTGEPELKIDERIDISVLTPGRLYSKRLLREFQYQKEAHAQRSEAGKRSGEARRQAKYERPFERSFNDRSSFVGSPVEREGQRNTNNDVSVCVPGSVLSSSSEESARETNSREFFQKLWEAYPEAGRTDWGGAISAWDVCIARHAMFSLEQLCSEVWAGLIRWKLSDKWQRGVIHSIANWIIKGIWKEHPPKARGQPQAQAEEDWSFLEDEPRHGRSA
jgi:hypothetical protein